MSRARPGYNGLGRDRSPPRQSDRFSLSRESSSGIHPSRQAALDGNRDGPPAARGFAADAPRGPPRGRGFSSRSDYRGDYRDRDPPIRDRRDSPPWPGVDRDRAWRPRDSSRTRSPPPPRGRDIRDARDLDRRESDFARPRRSSPDRGPPGPVFNDSRSAGPPPPAAPRGFGRGYRGRGRGDYDGFRGRGRGFSDDRDLFGQRSRSPRDRRADLDSRPPPRRDDSWPAKDDRARDADRFRDAQPVADELPSRRSSLPSASAASAAAQSLRRTSTINVAEPTRPLGHDSWNSSRIPSQSAGQSSRMSSPPRAPEVPAFGSVSVKPAAQSDGWNVWKAPTEPTKPPTAPAQMLKASASISKSDQIKIPPAAPRAERALMSSAGSGTSATSQSTTQPTSQIHTARMASMQDSHVLGAPRGPSAQAPSVPSVARSPPTGPRNTIPTPARNPSIRSDLQSSSHNNPIARSPPVVSAYPVVPPGPRSAMAPASSAAASNGIPTGPRNMTGRPNMAWQQRNRAQAVPQSSPSLVPAKRGSNGESKESTSVDDPESRDSLSKQFQIARDAYGSNGLTAKQESDEEEEDEVDDMDLDEADFDEKTAEFERAKAQLESKKHDLSSRHLRGATPLEQLGLLGALAQQDLQSLLALRNGKDPKGVASLAADLEMLDFAAMPPSRNGMPTPRLDARGEYGQLQNGDAEFPEQYVPSSPSLAYESPKSQSPPPIRTPELLALPFLNREPMTPFSDLGMCKETVQRHDSLKELVKARMLGDLNARLTSGEDEEMQYASLYREWKLHIKELDELAAEEKERERQQSLEKSVAPEVPEPTPALLTPNEGTRRARAFHSEYHVQKVMEESKRLQEEVEAARKKDALDAMGPDYNREAQIPDMISDAEARLRMFKDTSCMRNPHDAVVFYQLRPPRDTFTEEEHRTMVENFREFPKKWGKLTQGLHGRDYKDCINHYYATKWNKEFKQRPMKGKRKNLRGGKVPGKGRTNALISNLAGAEPDLYGGDETNAPLVSVTERGRPRRAAAPSFGDNNKQDDSGQTPGKKSSRPPMSTEASTEKVVRKVKTTMRGGGQRRGRTQQGTLKRSLSPQKLDPTQEMQGLAASDMGAVYADGLPRDDYFPRTLHNLPHAEGNRSLMPHQRISDLSHVQGSVQDLHFSSTPGVPGPYEINKNLGQGLVKGTPSSYWAVRETDSFPEYIKIYGTDWQAISTQMGGGKSATMCKNYFGRLVSQGRTDLEDMAAAADAKRGQTDSVTTLRDGLSGMSGGRRRAEEPQPMGHHPRMLAPSSGVDVALEVNETPSIVGPTPPADLPARYAGWNASPPHSTSMQTESVSRREHSRNTSSTQRAEPVDWVLGTSISGQPSESRAWATQIQPSFEESYRSRPVSRVAAQYAEPPAEYRARASEEEHRRAGLEAEERRRYAQDQSRDYRVGFERSAISASAQSTHRQETQAQYALPSERQSWMDRPSMREGDVRAQYQTLPADRGSMPQQSVSQYPRVGGQSSYRTNAAMYSPTQTPTFAPARPQLDSRYEPSHRAQEAPPRSGQPPSQYTAEDGYPRPGSSVGAFDPVRRPGVRDEELRMPQPSTAAAAVPAPPKAEPKRSSLMALLNNDDDPKPPRAVPAVSASSERTRTPPQYSSQHAPPLGPAPQTDRRDGGYGDAARAVSSSYQPSPLGQPSHGSPTLAGREPTGQSQGETRTDWRSVSRMSQYSQPGPSTGFSRPSEVASVLHRSSAGPVHSLSAHPGNAASPPPQQYAYGRPSGVRTPDPGHSRESSYSRPPPASYAPAAPQYGAPDRSSQYGERSQYGPPHSSSHTPQPSYSSSAYAAPAPSAPARYGTPSNQSAHSYNAASGFPPPQSATQAATQHEYGAPTQPRYGDRAAYEQQERERQREAELARPPGFGQSRYGENRYGEPRR